jgi:hypothetical protein
MPGFVQSPRARRRARWAIGGGIALAAVVAIALLVPNHKPANPDARGAEGSAQLATAGPKKHLSPADRHAVNVLLDRFMPAALTGRDPATAWALAGPELRSGSTLAAWRAGTSPIPRYPVLEKTFHHWQTIEVGRRYVIFNILLHAVPSAHLGSFVFSGEVVKRNGRWLVNRIYTIAIMNQEPSKTHEIGPADFKAPPPTSQTPSGSPALGNIGIVPVVSIIGLVLLIPLGLGIGAFVRARRWRRMVRASGRTELPPLPTGYAESQKFASKP